MEPINYLAGIPNPAGAVFEGLAQGQQRQAQSQELAAAQAREQRAAELQPFAVQGAQLDLDRGRQSMQVQADQNARSGELHPLQVQAQQQHIAAQQQQQQRAQAFQSEAARLASLGPDMTLADLQGVVTEFPDYADGVIRGFEAMNEAQRASVSGVMAQAAFALKNGNTATADALIDEYAAAAEASGNPAIAVTARGIQQTADINPDAALMALGLALQTIAPDAAKQIFAPGTEEPSEVRGLRIRASEAGLQPGTPEFQQFMLNAGSAPANFRALELQAQAAGLTQGTPEYANFMATRGAGAQAFAKTTGTNLANVETGGAAAGAVAQGAAEGKATAATSGELSLMERNMPGLLEVAEQLFDLSNTATYTGVGVLRDRAAAQLGLQPTQGAIDRAEYIAIVDNQVLPLLRQTFGAAFTAKEGETLRATLGDANKTPSEKQAVLRAFIAQKERDLEALQGQVSGGQPQQPVAAPQAAADEVPSYLQQFGGQ